MTQEKIKTIVIPKKCTFGCNFLRFHVIDGYFCVLFKKIVDEVKNNQSRKNIKCPECQAQTKVEVAYGKN